MDFPFQMDIQMQSSTINHVTEGFYFFEKAIILLSLRDSYLLIVTDSYVNYILYMCVKGFGFSTRVGPC